MYECNTLVSYPGKYYSSIQLIVYFVCTMLNKNTLFSVDTDENISK